MESTMLLLSVKELEDRTKLLNRRRGSVLGQNHIQRNRLLGHEQLMEDYFAEACEANSNYLKHRRNATWVMGFSAFQKISAAMRFIAYGIPANYTEEYLRIGEDTTSESVRMFARLIIKLFGPTYLRAPNEDDIKHLMEINEKRENEEAPTYNYKVMNNEYTIGYYLADGIYPDWATFVKSVKDPQDRIEAEFAKAQEAARKDIERAFGVLQTSFAIIENVNTHAQLVCDLKMHHCSDMAVAFDPTISFIWTRLGFTVGHRS
ncbi:uncharacterized protein [Lolium perenne]|uniref:uncharacterized protein n=1 Tax=Lolium perenne TaxID=4522 RepID=UPI003A999BD9